MGLAADAGDFAMKMIGPWIFIATAVAHFPQAFLSILSSGQYAKLLSPSEFLAEAFGRFWGTVGPSIKEDFKPRVVPVLQGRVRDGRIVDEPVYEPVSGVIMEIGAGSGMWMDVLAGFTPAAAASDGPAANLRKRKADEPNGGGIVTKIYGVEPNEISAASLRKRVTKLGLDGIYEVVPVGIEQVTDPTAWAGEIPEGSLDCIVCICCLCSIPDQEKNIQYLYKLLKPGGRWYIHEHVKATRGGPLLSLYQRYVGFFHGLVMGGCTLCRSTLENILAAGPFSEVNVGHPEDETGYEVIPWVMGILKK
ncbi:Methyltransferase type 11 [Cordyceps fumosorosea ARSEF 2679]|uniref:Methyltransferase type 11 n=1 Tax=Cordyceps fumosorosea (strain ARSEF 2679) TaxID=1081104 RepID=A0A167VVK7_CORFA|nr:Methyltransferase type 11 [Cordyceps fumosorosea ARSEF 2679]OAA63027.1 Methyltransferase type 11 [Cordyceps fumosorosea ARSEF 2679]